MATVVGRDRRQGPRHERRHHGPGADVRGNGGQRRRDGGDGSAPCAMSIANSRCSERWRPDRWRWTTARLDARPYGLEGRHPAEARSLEAREAVRHDHLHAACSIGSRILSIVNSKMAALALAAREVMSTRPCSSVTAKRRGPPPTEVPSTVTPVRGHCSRRPPPRTPCRGGAPGSRAPA